MNKEFLDKLLAAHRICSNCPTPMEIVNFFKDLSGVLYLDFSKQRFFSTDQIEAYLMDLKQQFATLLARNPDNELSRIQSITEDFFHKLPEVYDLLATDIEAIFKGDPAATSEREIIRSYPGFYAIMVYRVSHAMVEAGVRDIPRILTEYAHSKTGIDIHPRANIGPYFCIDH